MKSLYQWFSISLCVLAPSHSFGASPFRGQCQTDNYLMAASIDVGSTPKGAAITNDGETAYVANMYSRSKKPTVTLVDLTSFETRKIITPVGIPGYDYGEILGNIEVTMGPSGQYAYVTRASGNQNSEVAASGLVTAIDTVSENIQGYFPLYPAHESQGPSGSKVIQLRPEASSSQQQIAYVANWFTNHQHISVIDLGHLKPLAPGDTPPTHFDAFVKNIKLQTKFPSSRRYAIAPRGIQFTADGRHAVVAAYNSKTLFVIDAVEHKQIAELPPIPSSFRLNFRHFAYDEAQDYLYISHMLGDRISRIDLSQLIEKTVQRYNENSQKPVLFETDIWPQIQVPFETGDTYIRTDLRYPNGHPYDTGGNPVQGPSNPNTIVLHPNNRYLFVSNRMTYSKSYNETPDDHLGKIDMIDTQNGSLVCSLNAGSQATALDISFDGSTLISSAFQKGTLFVFDTLKLINDYESSLTLKE